MVGSEGMYLWLGGGGISITYKLIIGLLQYKMKLLGGIEIITSISSIFLAVIY